ncbi:hypothetical protein FOL47_009438 [Perkinsus chesapeaki]|uniref:3-methyl-2-oxobutanoate hydroxymethyltransferase n=1 Tax=Perkinsus chesapeaki TaxID=330153 RepID=A0A7J6L871_PERCH|nr:hypothetical protein FOL47_009438 [Perkinsus chesapeaki]
MSSLVPLHRATSACQQVLSSALRTSATRSATINHRPARMFSSASPYGSAKASSHDKKMKLPKKVSLTQLNKFHRQGRKITMMTAYDAMTAGIAEECGVDLLLVGDSVSNVVHGFDSTVPISMDAMILHTQAVRRGLVNHRPMIIGDMPFGSFLTYEDGVKNGARFIKEGNADIVKLECPGSSQEFSTELVRRMTAAGIGVVGHIGLTPQSHVQMGGYRIQGKAASAAAHMIEFAKELEKAGCIMMVLECVPGEVARLVTEALTVPTIGIGSGPDTSGQVLVVHDLLGLTPRAPKLAKQFVNLRELMNIGVMRYVDEVKSGQFPGPETYTKMKPIEYSMLVNEIKGNSGESETENSTAECDKPVARMSSNPTRVAVVGGGAMGTFFAKALSKKVPDVVLITGPHSHADAMSSSGLECVDSQGRVLPALEGNSSSTNFRVVHNVSDCLSAFGGTTPELVVVASKAWQLEDPVIVKKLLSGLLADGAPVLSIQNGIGSVDALSVVSNNIWQAVTSIGCNLPKPGVLEVNILPGTDAWMKSLNRKTNVTIRGILGLPIGLVRSSLIPPKSTSEDSIPEDPLAGLLSSCFEDAKIPCRVDDAKDTDEAQQMVWDKMIINAAINPVTAVFGVLNGELLESSQLYSLASAAAHEAYNVAKVMGVEVPCEYSDELWSSVAHSTATNVSSMLRDVRLGRPTEIAFINGQVVRFGSQFGVPTPVNQALVTMVNSMKSNTSSSSSSSTLPTAHSSAVGVADGKRRVEAKCGEALNWVTSFIYGNDKNKKPCEEVAE